MASLSRTWRVAILLGAALGAATGAYALAGFVIAPYLVQTQLWPWLSNTLGGHFQAGRTAVDPFRLSLTVDGFSLDSAEGKNLASIDELSVEVDGRASLRTQTLVLAKAKMVKPSIHILLDQQGKPNFAFLGGDAQPDEPPSKAFPFLLTDLKIEQGVLDFEDQSRGKGFKKVFSAFNASLENLGTATDTPARFKLDAQGESQELLTGELDWHLATTALAGEFTLHGLGLAPLATWLAADWPYTVDSGTLSLTLKYRYAQDTELDLSFAEAQIQQFKLSQAGQPFFSAPSITAKGFSFQQKTQQIELQSLGLDTPALQTPTPLSADSLSAQGLSFHAKTRHIKAQALAASKLKLDQDARPLAEVATVAANGFAFMTETGRLDLERLSLDNIELKTPAPNAAARSLTAQGLVFQTKTGRAEGQSLAAAQIKLGMDAQPLAEIGDLAANGFAFMSASGQLALERLSLSKIELKTPSPIVDREGKPRLHRVDAVALDGLALDMAKRTLQLDRLQSNGTALAAWRAQDGSTGLAGAPKAFLQTKSSGAKTPAAPWQVRLGRVELNDNNIVLRDFSQDPPTGIYFSHLNLLVKQFDSAAPKPFWLGVNTGLSANGRIALEGQVKLSPPTANLKLYVDDLSLPPFQPYLDQAVRIRVVKGMANMNADIDYDSVPSPKLRIGGDLAVANFDSDDKKENREFLNWKGLRLSGLIFESDPQRLSIRDITATEPYIRAVIDADKRFNVTENLSPPVEAKPAPPAIEAKPAAPAKKTAAPAAKPTPAASPGDDPPAVVIGAFNIHQGNADFADMTIKPVGFSAEIHDLNGNIRSLSSRQDAKSDVLLEGKLNQGSQVKLFGKINPFSILAYTDITMHFNGVNLTTLSPYAAKFAGYRIEKGKLSMDLRYKLENNRLTADNSFVLDQLQLGEKVDSPTATTLPIRMAIALLKDSDGKIGISLPISGDLSNPDISIWGLLGEATGSLLRKTLAAPFTLLGSLAGSSTEELEAVKFDPGSTALSTQEKDQLAAIAKALKNRPGLNLEIKGMADQDLDRPVLAEQDLTRQLRNAKLIELGRRKGKNAEWDEGALSEEDYQRLLTNLYRWKNPDAQELQGLKPGASLSGDLLASAKRKLLNQWTVSELDLRGLARARGESIRGYLVQEQGLPDERIYLSAVKLGGIGEQEAKEIKALLSLSGS